jgi:hypothetical protein
MNEDIMNQFGFQKEVTRVRNGKCPFCNKEIIMSKFCDEKSRREFRISGLCQMCQDDMFNEE